MSTRLLFAFLLTFGLCTMDAQQGARDNAAAIIAAMHNIRAASATGDAEKWKSLVAEDCVFIEPTGRLRSREWHIPAKKTANPPVKVATEFSELAVRDHGDTAVLTYIETTQAQIGDQSTRSVVRFTEAYKRAVDSWQMILSAETPVPQRQAITVDPATYDDLIGDYQLAPGMIGTVTRDGNRLMLKGTGWKQAYELLPVSKDTFFVREFENTEITFIRDEHGHVIHQLSRTNGQEIIAKKLK